MSSLHAQISLSPPGPAVGSKGSSNTSSDRRTPTTEQLHPLSDAWNIDPSELAVCQLPDGRDWLLGAGSFGKLFGLSRMQVLHLDSNHMTESKQSINACLVA